jgi:hypothetical protein
MASKFGRDRFDSANEGPIMEPVLILGEGKRDASFLAHLMEERRLGGFQVGFAAGKDNLPEYLSSLRPRIGFDQSRHLIVVGDNDADPPKAFKRTQDHIRDAGFPVPERLNETATSKLGPAVTVIMLPAPGEPGNLDVLLLRSVLDGSHPLHDCFEAFWRCCEVDDLETGRTAKVKLATAIAASCTSNPGCSLVFVWSQKGNPISLSHTCFDDLERLFRALLTE